MRKRIAVIIGIFTSLLTMAQQPPTVYVDQKGVMRWSGTREEASFFGVNYTLPFAHAYRATGYLGIDRKAAIDQDVYHFARLGFNAFRIHIWDVEISDAQGNLIENEHLDLLDYLIAKLQARNIYTVITAQTNFGNGYPERNQPTDGFSYQYGKCDIHANPKALTAQERYLKALVNHVNPYTKVSYQADPMVVGFEINNEPCHSGTIGETKQYIDRMLHALKQAGNRKPVFYNVSHNLQNVEAYYATAIQGTTYQWYPTGLVSGHTRTENYLPNVDEYAIPFGDVKGFKNKAKLVYEFDPADILGSYIYPAAVRSFRSAGFQWITQFSYDPLALAHVNTEYQTHYLNLAYTPAKAISMKIAAQAAYTLPRNKSYGTYPANTRFEDFQVSYHNDLSELNTATRFYHSNHTQSMPVDVVQLESIAGVGSSTIVDYPGTGAYFIDKVEDGVWRLEVMPDVIRVSDPFAKPSLDKEVMRIYHGTWDMAVKLPNLGNAFTATGIDAGNTMAQATTNGILAQLKPGVYLLTRQDHKPSRNWSGDSAFGNIRLGEFVAPKPSPVSFTIDHASAKTAQANQSLTITAAIAGNTLPDSVLIYTDQVSFWNDKNPYYKMERTRGYQYQAVVPGSDLKKGAFNYNIVVFGNGHRLTAPSMVKQSPLDWDYTEAQFYSTQICESTDPLVLFTVSDTYSDLEAYTLPEWIPVHRQVVAGSPSEKNKLLVSMPSGEGKLFLRKNVIGEIKNRLSDLNGANYLCIQLKSVQGVLEAGVVTSDAITYRATVVPNAEGVVRIPVNSLKKTQTALLPMAYPVFMNQYFNPSTKEPLKLDQIQMVELMVEDNGQEPASIEIGAIWME